MDRPACVGAFSCHGCAFGHQAGHTRRVFVHLLSVKQGVLDARQHLCMQLDSRLYREVLGLSSRCVAVVSVHVGPALLLLQLVDCATVPCSVAEVKAASAHSSYSMAHIMTTSGSSVSDVAYAASSVVFVCLCRYITCKACRDRPHSMGSWGEVCEFVLA